MVGIIMITTMLMIIRNIFSVYKSWEDYDIENITAMLNVLWYFLILIYLFIGG